MPQDIMEMSCHHVSMYLSVHYTPKMCIIHESQMSLAIACIFLSHPLFNKWGFCIGEGLGLEALPCFDVPKRKGDNPSVGHRQKNKQNKKIKWARAPLPFSDIKTCPNCEVHFRMCNIFVEKFEISGKCINYHVVSGQRFF